MGVDYAKNEHKHFNEYRHLEKFVAKHFNNKSHCIMRSSMWHQFFYYYGPLIEDENKIELPMRETTEFGLIDLTDLVDAAYNISSFSDTANDLPLQIYNNLAQLCIANLRKKNKTLFEFTPRHNTTPEQLIQAASGGLERENMTYEKTSPENMYDYLHRIHNDNRFRQRPIHQRATDIVEDQLKLKEDRPYTFPLGRYLNDCVIEVIVEYWKLANSGKEQHETDDLERAIGRYPTTVNQFFKHNRDQFNRLR